MTGQVLIAGGGPAGAAAAIAARLNGVPATIFERHTGCRHKVCGEFLSPFAADLLAALQVWEDFLRLKPQKIVRCVLHLGSICKRWNLTQPAWGLSRLELDRLLLEKAAGLGATLQRGDALDTSKAPSEGALIVASGRKPSVPGRNRLFGFKAHFQGPSDDAVELFFQDYGYAGVSGVGNGLTNVCGMAPESVLRDCHFDFDELLLTRGPLAARLRPLRRHMDWITTGPLSFSPPTQEKLPGAVYPAGDSLGFVDPYTGSGILNALLTGRMAGIAASRGVDPGAYLGMCHTALSRAYRVSSVLRMFAGHAGAHWLARWIPGEVLFRWTRAQTSPL